MLHSADIGRLNQFANDALHKDAAQLKSYWSAQVFSEMSSPPDFVDGDKAVKQRMAKSPGAIGYIDSTSVDDSVKVVFTLVNKPTQYTVVSLRKL